MDQSKSLRRLMEGNKRFVQGIRSADEGFHSEKLKEAATNGQRPFSIVLTCADSRVPVETIFDCGVGDIFVIRVAGNVISSDFIASIEYAASQFGTPLCVVMGHTGCGAVQAAIEYALTGQCDLSEHGKQLLRKILPAVKGAINKSGQDKGLLAQNTSLLNIRRNSALILKKSRFLEGLSSEGKFSVIGAIYDLHTGKVDFSLEKEYRAVPDLKQFKSVEQIA